MVTDEYIGNDTNHAEAQQTTIVSGCNDDHVCPLGISQHCIFTGKKNFRKITILLGFAQFEFLGAIDKTTNGLLEGVEIRPATLEILIAKQHRNLIANDSKD